MNGSLPPGAKKPKSLFRRALAPVVLIGMVVGIHVGWYQLQKNDDFVPESERRYPGLTRIFAPNGITSLFSWKKEDAKKDADSDIKEETK